MAVDEEWGFSKNGTMPWPKNTQDLQHFKETTNNNVVVMGRLTWDDPFMPTPLKNRINILVTSKSKRIATAPLPLVLKGTSGLSRIKLGKSII